MHLRGITQSCFFKLCVPCQPSFLDI